MEEKYQYRNNFALLRWVQPSEDKMLGCVNTSRTETCFFVMQITGGEIRVAYRKRSRQTKETSEGKSERTWDGTWEWKHLRQELLRVAGLQMQDRLGDLHPFSTGHLCPAIDGLYLLHFQVKTTCGV